MRPLPYFNAEDDAWYDAMHFFTNGSDLCAVSETGLYVFSMPDERARMRLEETVDLRKSDLPSSRQWWDERRITVSGVVNLS